MKREKKLFFDIFIVKLCFNWHNAIHRFKIGWHTILLSMETITDSMGVFFAFSLSFSPQRIVIYSLCADFSNKSVQSDLKFENNKNGCVLYSLVRDTR